MKTQTAIIAGAVVLATAGIGAASTHWINGSAIRPGSVQERALAPAVQRKINAMGLMPRTAPLSPTVVVRTGTLYVPYSKSTPSFSISPPRGIYVVCPAGMPLTGGGYRMDASQFPSTASPQIIVDGPISYGPYTGSGWEVDVRNSTGQNVTVQAYAYCQGQ